jgi:hypothetical protein
LRKNPKNIVVMNYRLSLSLLFAFVFVSWIFGESDSICGWRESECPTYSVELGIGCGDAVLRIVCCVALGGVLLSQFHSLCLLALLYLACVKHLSKQSDARVVFWS